MNRSAQNITLESLLKEYTFVALNRVWKLLRYLC